MRLTCCLFALTALSACLQSTSEPTTTAAAPAAPFTVPMDPGQIACASLGNPTAMTAATDWVAGQARAELLSGRRAELPDVTTLAGTLTRACTAAPRATIRAALASS